MQFCSNLDLALLKSKNSMVYISYYVCRVEFQPSCSLDTSRQEPKSVGQAPVGQEREETIQTF